MLLIVDDDPTFLEKAQSLLMEASHGVFSPVARSMPSH